MSEAVPINWCGQKVQPGTLTVIDNKKSRSTPVPFTFPNGHACPPGTQIDRFGRFCVNSFAVNMNADGTAYSQLIFPPSPVQACLGVENGKTQAERNATLIEYNAFIRDYEPGSGDDAADATAAAWAARAAAVNNNGWNGAGITIAHVANDALQINGAQYNTTMDQF